MIRMRPDDLTQLLRSERIRDTAEVAEERAESVDGLLTENTNLKMKLIACNERLKLIVARLAGCVNNASSPSNMTPTQFKSLISFLELGDVKL